MASVLICSVNAKYYLVETGKQKPFSCIIIVFLKFLLFKMIGMIDTKKLLPNTLKTWDQNMTCATWMI